MPGCVIARCRVADFVVANLPISKTAPRQKAVEGAYEQIVYNCGATTSGLEISRNVENAMTQAGFKIAFKDAYFTSRFDVTGQKGPQWLHVHAEKSIYFLTAVKVKEMEQAMKANAEGWAEQMNQSGRVSIYGINFDTAKATIRPDSEPVLNEVATLLQRQPDWYLMIAGHTDNVGTDAVNVPLSRQRAEAVIAWLGAKGIDKGRLTAAGFGSKKPLEDNSTDDGKAKNRRVDLIKLY
jgi:outer membrane protein OmpA-like peptidoglycan-associated protein